jgi:hypothetical protein
MASGWCERRRRRAVSLDSLWLLMGRKRKSIDDPLFAALELEGFE